MTTTPSRQPLCIIGLGLIGGSLLKAAALAGYRTYGYNRGNDTVVQAATDGYNASSDLDATLRRASEDDALIVVAVPMPAISSIFRHIAQAAPQCPVTDVVSVKAPVLELAHRAGLTRFVGGHPMAGTAQSGWAATDAQLFTGATWVITPESDSDRQSCSLTSELAVSVGATVYKIEADEHDLAAAQISHAPHLVAAMVAAAATAEHAHTLAASSFRDITRVAATSPALVRAMVEANRGAVLDTLDQYISLLESARTELSNNGTAIDLTTAGFEAKRRLNTSLHKRSATRVAPDPDNP